MLLGMIDSEEDTLCGFEEGSPFVITKVPTGDQLYLGGNEMVFCWRILSFLEIGRAK